MTGCAEPCPAEAFSRDPGVSPGPVENDETLCRGAFDPMHYDRKGVKIQPSVLRKRDLAQGQLSVYRESDRVSFSHDQVTDQIRRTGPSDQVLKQILSARASDVRAVRSPGVDGRSVCVRDDCDCDASGNKHHAHAHIALCESAFPMPVDLETEAFKQVHRDLVTLFKRVARAA